MAKKSILKAKNVYISDDFPPEVQQRRKLILPIFFKALEICPNLNPKLRVDSLILGGKEYGIHNINSVPVNNLHPHSIFIPKDKGATAFFSKHSPLSNHYPCKLQDEGIQVSSSEQCYMYKKAMKFKDVQTAQQILKTQTPEEEFLTQINGREKTWQAKSLQG